MNTNKNNSINNDFYTDIKTILHKARHSAFKAVNFFMVEAYWNIGKRIVDEEQKGEKHENKLRSLIKPITSNCIQLMKIIGKITIDLFRNLRLLPYYFVARLFVMLIYATINSCFSLHVRAFLMPKYSGKKEV
jgi:hypothetical protein